jgi:hypothetical protein
MEALQLKLGLLGALLLQQVAAQKPAVVYPIAIDPSRPYIDIVFDRYGKRSPVFQGESDVGLWLTLRNNSIVSIKVYTLRRHNENPGELLVHEVIEEHGSPVDTVVGPQPKIGKPLGYWGTDIVSWKEIEPGGNLLFSVPLRDVTRRWSVRVEVFLQGASVGKGKQPRTFAEFDWASLPAEAQRASDVELFGSLPSRRN